MIVDPDDLSRRERYRLMISAIVPRPIAWVTTLSAAGVVNAAPFSFFNGISSSPPLVGVCVGSRSDGRKKDTLKFAEERPEMVVNMATFDLRDEMVACSKDFEPGVSEVDEVGLATAPSDLVAPPRLTGSPVNLECRVERIIDFDGTSMIVGRVLRVHVQDDVAEDGQVSFQKARPLGRLGGIDYLDCEEGVLEVPPA